MATSTPYARTLKTKKEQYEEKLKQRNENEEWIFGNKFGRPGGGAPLRDKYGHIISNLKSISNDNIFKYNPEEFTKGDNTIVVGNNQIFERNITNTNAINSMSDPFNPFRNYINQFEPNNLNIDLKNNPNINYNNIQGQIQTPIKNEQYNNLNQISNENRNELFNNNNNNQYGYFPYAIPGPYGLPVIPVYIQGQDQKNEILDMTTNKQVITPRPVSTIKESIQTKISPNNFNNTFNNYNNFNLNQDNLIDSEKMTKKFIKKLPESTIFNSNVNFDKIKLDKEREKEQWKKELIEQINEKKRRDLKNKKLMEEMDKKEILDSENYFKLKKKQQEEQAKKHMAKIRRQQNDGGMGNILDLSTDMDPANRSNQSQMNNIIVNENDLSQNNIPIQDNLIDNNQNQDNINYNNMNNMYQNQNQYNLEEDNFKNYIDRQYNLLSETLNNDINNEMMRITEEVNSNYSPFTKNMILMNTNSKTTAELSKENELKLQKIQNLIEERKLVDYILGRRERPPTPKNEVEERIDLPVPSYFGINRDSAENKYLGLHSKSTFITKNENIANFIASGHNEGNIPSVGKDLNEKKKLNDKFNQVMNEDYDINLDYNQKLSSGKSTFGTNIQNDLELGGVSNMAKNLDNISTFIKLDNNREKINLDNDKKIKFVPGVNTDFLGKRDRGMEELFKELDKIYELTNKIDVTSNARNIKDALNKKDKEKIDNNNKNNISNMPYDETNYSPLQIKSKYLKDDDKKIEEKTETSKKTSSVNESNESESNSKSNKKSIKNSENKISSNNQENQGKISNEEKYSNKISVNQIKQEQSLKESNTEENKQMSLNNENYVKESNKDSNKMSNKEEEKSDQINENESNNIQKEENQNEINNDIKSKNNEEEYEEIEEEYEVD